MIDSNTLVWKDGMGDWKKMYLVDELKEIICNTETEITESITRNKIQTAYAMNKDSKIDNYYFGVDGNWHVYNPLIKEWSTQDNVKYFNIETRVNNR
jgi:hypothetical protein